MKYTSSQLETRLKKGFGNMDPETFPEAYSYPYLYELMGLSGKFAYPVFHLPNITGVWRAAGFQVF